MAINSATATQADVKAAETSELLVLYNTLTGKNIKGFYNRTKAEEQTWKAIQQSFSDEVVEVSGEQIKVHAVKKIEGKGKAKPKKEKAVRVPREKSTAKPSKREAYENYVIEVLVEKNPKREGTRAWDKFAYLMKMDGKTIGDWRAIEGNCPKLDDEPGWPSGELRWCLKMKFVKVVPVEKAAKAA